MTAPRRDRYIVPRTGADSRSALVVAVESLCAARDLDAHDPTARLHVLASLAAELEGRLRSAVADARRYGCSWAEVADLLGVTRASAWQRHARREAGTVNNEKEARP